MGEPSPVVPPSAQASADRLDSWKEIAAYLNRDVTTVQRWEKREGMPVHRHLHDKRGSVYALGSELDAWRQNRRSRLDEEEEDDLNAEAAVHEDLDGKPKPASPVHNWFLLAAVVLIALVGVAYIAIRNRVREAARPKIASIAVLPLKNLSGDATQEYLADGMTEELIGRLSAIRGLRVISRTSAMHFKDPHLSAPEIAKTLHVDALVEGSVIREGRRVRVHAQLIRAASDEHFWSETYDRDLQDALALESEVAQAIARKVEVTVTGEERGRLVAAARQVSPDVYESYLKGKFAFGKGNSRTEIEKSIVYLEDTINRDPTFAPAYVGLANAYLELSSVFIGAPPEDARAKAMSAARKALELDPALAEAHIMLAGLYQIEFDWAEAETEYRRALELTPGTAAAQMGYAGWLLSQGRIEESLTWAQRAREYDPLAVSGGEIGWILFFGRRYDEAIREYRSALAVDPDDTRVLEVLGIALMAKGQPEEAIAPLETVISVTHGSPAACGLLIRAFAHAGRRNDALRLLRELKGRRRAGYVPAAAFVDSYLGLGDTDQAFDWFELAYREQSFSLQFLKVSPFLDPIRSDPRLADLVHRVGLDKEY